ncbi:hypothetical protein [Alkalihalobacillus sp. TS-13]|uniref:hypothetical protein n=1 Tax=Alkalihalobacillus sp. TS-13 TaxID=2842455 RepID=UPI001C87105E|nr:hypothetical protein [Alkalihalobacillus sp. TS-13]
MIERKEIEMMKVAYQQLYEIENALRKFVSIRMNEEYGPFWYYKASKLLQRKPPRAPIANLYLHELERSFLRVYPPFEDLTPTFFSHLHNLYPIRNRIAHSHPITEDQADSLSQCHSYLTEYMT